MPQIYIIFGTGTVALLTECGAVSLGGKLIPVVEEGFDISGKNDTAFTCVRAMGNSRNEADVQVEIRYTAGEDEYEWGRPFDPTKEEQTKVAKAIRGTFLAFLDVNGLPRYTLSVWFKPYYKGIFKMF